MVIHTSSDNHQPTNFTLYFQSTFLSAPTGISVLLSLFFIHGATFQIYAIRFLPPMAKEYRDVLREEEEEPLTGDNGGGRGVWKSKNDHIATRIRLMSLRWPWIAHGVLLSTSFAFLALALYVRSTTQSDPLVATYSPAQSAVRYEDTKFDLPPVPEGPFVGKGPEVDASWDYITDSIGDQMVSREEMVKMNLDPNGALEITDPATGKQGFRVAIEVFHQLHCLNLLRQNNHKEYYAPLGGDTAAPIHDLHGHLDHCIDALRQFVMCQGDINVFAFRFPFNDGDPWPDYSTPRVCKNYASIRQWAVDHTVERGVNEPEH